MGHSTGGLSMLQDRRSMIIWIPYVLFILKTFHESIHILNFDTILDQKFSEQCLYSSI